MQPLSDEWQDANGNTIEGRSELYREQQMRLEFQIANNTRRRYNLSSEEYDRYLEACKEYRHKKEVGAPAKLPQPGDFKN